MRCVHLLPSFLSFAISHLSLSARHSSNLDFTQENGSIFVSVIVLHRLFFPLIMKWEAVALWLENPIENRVIVEKYFSDAIINLLTPENGFAIRTLALPVIQCFGIVNNRNEFHARYNTLLNELTNEVNGFGKYIETSEVLVSIKNECNIWERALSLPFIYS